MWTNIRTWAVARKGGKCPSYIATDRRSHRIIYTSSGWGIAAYACRLKMVDDKYQSNAAFFTINYADVRWAAVRFPSGPVCIEYHHWETLTEALTWFTKWAPPERCSASVPRTSCLEPHAIGVRRYRKHRLLSKTWIVCKVLIVCKGLAARHRSYAKRWS